VSIKLGVAVAAALVAVLVLSVTALPSAAQEPPPPIAAEPLTARSDFSDAGTEPMVLTRHLLRRTR
jgi:hypothetical protein